MQVAFISSIYHVDGAQWDALWPDNYPFTQHGFLALLEDTGCTSAATGWSPHHLVIRDQGQLLAVMPFFSKTHSYGEYVFDWGWADAYQRNGLDYYPKLVNAIPFTPATGPRLAVAAAADRSEIFRQLATTLHRECSQIGASGWHSLFPAADQFTGWPQPLIERLGCQFHWFNQDFVDFDQFLATLNSRKRKNLLRERRKAAETGLQIDAVAGSEVTPQQWLAFYHLYQHTYHKRSGRNGYLTEAFFQGISQALTGQVFLVRACEGDQLVAGALYFADNHTLYGRYWGAMGEFDSLHFECCYYQGIALAIRLGLQRFDPGAQGEHKIQRGFTPVYTHSYHTILHPEFHRAIAHFCREEKPHITRYTADARELLPFKEGITLVAADSLLKPPTQ